MKTLFICLDTVRRDFLSYHGNTWVQTPNLQRLAERSVIFDNHWVGSLPCMPARREFMTGRVNFPFRGWGPLEPFDDILPLRLRSSKDVFSHLITDHYHYLELGAQNYHCFFDTWDFYRGQENDPWVSLVDGPALPPDTLNRRMKKQNYHNRSRQMKEEDFSAAQSSMAACRWLDDNKDADDWFLQLEIFDPHEPFYCTDKYRELYNDTWDGPLWDWPAYEVVSESPEAVEHIRKCYAGLLTMTDHWLGKVFDKLDELNLWEDTLVIFTTDHGTMLGEHNYWMKNYMPVYNEIARIPLTVHLPGGKNAGTRVDHLTQTIDIMPTIMEHHGAKLPPHVQGGSLLKPINGTVNREAGLFGYFGKAVNVTDGRHVYFRNPVTESGGPLHSYTAMPPGGWFSNRKSASDLEMGRYFGHMYNIPVWKVPESGALPHSHEGDSGYLGRHELFDIQKDVAQQNPLNDAKAEAKMIDHLKTLMVEYEAPAEQFERLGL